MGDDLVDGGAVYVSDSNSPRCLVFCPWYGVGAACGRVEESRLARGGNMAKFALKYAIQELICIVPFGGSYSEPKGNSS